MSDVVLVTGGTSGIGLALAEAFIENGDVVAVSGRSESALDRFSGMHPNALAIRADVTDHHARTRMLDAVQGRFGRLDILVNNAGSFVERDYTAVGASADLNDELDVNFSAPIQVVGEALERWPSLNGIVFVTAGYALSTSTRAPTYGAAKAGVHAFADGLRQQLATSGTHVLEVLPPRVDTPMNAGVVGTKLPPSEIAAVTLDALAKRKPMAFAGSTRFLPALLRIAPHTVRRIVAKS